MCQKKRTVLRILFTALSVLTAAFIFGNSLQTADASSAESGRILRLLNDTLRFLRTDFALTEQMVRKTAHFTEFFILGTLLSAMYLSYTGRKRLSLSLSLAGGLSVAVTDEFLQTFSDGRSAEFRDILLDFSGVVCAVAIFTVILILYDRNRSKRPKKEREDKN